MIRLLVMCVSGRDNWLRGLMDSRITVFLIVMLLAVLRGLMQRSKVQREIDERQARGLVSLKSRRIRDRTGPVVDSDSVTETDTQSAGNAD